MKLAMDADTARANEIRESMRHTKEQSILEDIRDLLYVNNLSLGALINLMLTVGTPMNEDDRRSVFKGDAKSAMEILDKMDKRNERIQRQLESMTQQYEQAKRRSGNGSQT